MVRTGALILALLLLIRHGPAKQATRRADRVRPAISRAAGRRQRRRRGRRPGSQHRRRFLLDADDRRDFHRRSVRDEGEPRRQGHRRPPLTAAFSRRASGCAARSGARSGPSRTHCRVTYFSAWRPIPAVTEQVVVGYARNGCTLSHAFRWEESTGMVDLGASVAGVDTLATGVSADGQVAVGYETQPTGFAEAVKWVGTRKRECRAPTAMSGSRTPRTLTAQSSLAESAGHWRRFPAIRVFKAGGSGRATGRSACPRRNCAYPRSADHRRRQRDERRRQCDRRQRRRWRARRIPTRSSGSIASQRT